MKDKTVILVAVRLTSRRLKKKALLNLHKKPLILRLTDRIKKSNLSAQVIWCTSIGKEDDELERLGNNNEIEVFRGPKKDVMMRFILAAEKYNAKNIVRVTGDNPLTDPKVIDFLIKKHKENKMEYTCCNSIPVGTRSEIIDLKMLKKCHKMIRDPNHTEYMTWMLNKPDYFKTLDVVHPNDKLNRPEIFLSVDFQEDYRNMLKIYNHFKGKIPSLEKIIKWIDKNPKLLSKLRRRRRIKEKRDLIKKKSY